MLERSHAKTKNKKDTDYASADDLASDLGVNSIIDSGAYNDSVDAVCASAEIFTTLPKTCDLDMNGDSNAGIISGGIDAMCVPAEVSEVFPKVFDGGGKASEIFQAKIIENINALQKDVQALRLEFRQMKTRTLVCTQDKL